MAGEVDDIVQNVVLTGNEEVSSAFDKIQESGTRAFEAIESAMDHSVFSFAGLITAVGGITAAIAGIGVGMFAFTQSTEAAVSELSDLSSATGIAIEDIGGLKEAFAAGGVSSETMTTAFRRLSLITQQTWAEIKKASRDGSDQLRQDAIAVSNAQIAEEQATQKLATITKDQALQRQANTNSVADARLKLDELNAASFKAAGLDTSALDAQLASQRELNQLKSAQLALQQAQKKAADDAINAPLEALKVENDRKKAKLDSDAAERKAADDQKNDIGNIIEAVKNLAAGESDALKSINPSVDNLVKGVIGAAGEASKSLGTLRGDITDLASPGPATAKVLETLGQTLKNLDDAQARTALSSRLLGRTIGQDFINVIADPSKLAAFQERVKELGLNLDEIDVQISEKFRGALFTLQTDIELVANKLATAFGPGFTQILNALDAALIGSKDQIIAFASSIASQAVPIVESFIRVLAGAPDAAKDQWLVDYIDKLKLFGSAIAEVARIFGSVVDLILTTAGGFAKTINDTFGTSLNAIDVLFVAWAGSIAAKFLIVQAAGTEAAAVIAAEWAGLVIRLGVIGGVLLAIKGGIDLINISLKDDAAQRWAIMWEAALGRIKAIATFLSGDFKKALNDINDVNKKQIAAEKELDDNAKKLADEKTKRDDDVTKAEEDARKKGLDANRVATDTEINSSKKSADSRIADNQRVAKSTQDVVEQTKRGAQDLAHLAQSGLTPALGSQVGDNTPSGDFHSVPNQFNGPQTVKNNGIDVAQQLKQLDDALDKTNAVTDGTMQIIRAVRPELVPLPTARNTTGAGETTGFEDFHRAAQDLEAVAKAEKDNSTGRDTSRAAQDVKDPLRDLLGDPGEIKSFFHDTVHDFITKAFSDPGSLTSPDRPERQPAPPTNPDNLPDVGASPLATAIDNLSSKLSDLINSLAASLNKPQDQTITDPSQLGIRGDATDTATTGLADAGTSASNASGQLDSLTSAASNAAAALNSVPSGGGNAAVTAAGGGHIRGPGGPTSDSIAAWLSDGEFVQSAKAVSFWGTDFMHAINQMRMPRFSLGGLVSPTLPRFADGGFVSSPALAPHLGTIDLRTNIGDVRVSVERNTLSKLRQAAVLRNIGADRKPGWVR